MKRKWIGGAVVTIALVLVIFQNCGQLKSYDSPSVATGQPSVALPKTTGHIIRVGEFIMTDLARAASLNIGGRVLMDISSEGTTEVFTFASGLTPSTAYMAHVHNLPCSLGGGPHYKLDNSVSTAVESNEIWPLFSTDANGEGFGHVISRAIARADAQSIVIHDAVTPANRLACADLMPERKAVTKGGKFAQLAAGASAGVNPVGSGVITRNGNGIGQTIVRLSVGALSATTPYMAHVHNLPCSNADGGPHYKRNGNVTEVTASSANELWPLFTTDATGRAITTLYVDGHVARADAASIVIHNPANMTQRLSCSDLTADAGFVTTVAGLTAGMNINGWAMMTRKTSGTTDVSLSVTGLTPNTSFMAHVHDHPCNTGGGGHYKKDISVTTAVQANEIWFMLAADATGAATATATADHIVRPEAQSVVIHDPTTPTTRLACVDLY